MRSLRGRAPAAGWQSAPTRSAQRSDTQARRPALHTCRARFEDVAAEAEDYYALLDLPRDASEADIKRRYRALQRQHHPDIAGDESREMSSRLNVAYNVLTNKESRQKYDHLMRREGVSVQAFERQEGLTGPLAERAVPLGELQFEGIAPDVAIDWLQQWGTSITFGCENPFPAPLQCDPVPEGVRFAAIDVQQGVVSCIGELYLEVDVNRIHEEQVASVMVTRVSKTPEYGMPGESAILKTLKNALGYKRKQRNGMEAKGWFATLLSGSLGFLPLVHFGNQDTGYDSYRIPARCSVAKPVAMQSVD